MDVSRYMGRKRLIIQKGADKLGISDKYRDQRKSSAPLI